MAKSDEYERRAASWDYHNLRAMFDDILNAVPDPAWPPGKRLEYLVLRAFELEGADVKWPYDVKDPSNNTTVLEQIDGAVYTEHIASLIEAKDTSDEIAIDVIAKMRNQLLRRPSSTIGMIFSRSGYTEPAITLARFGFPQTILVWQGTEIELALARERMCEGLKLKYRHAVEQGWPDYHVGAAFI